MKWTPLPPIPRHAHLAPMSDWRHRPTPQDVIDRRAAGEPVPALWVDPERRLAGVVTADDQLAWEPSDAGSVELDFARAGTDPGYVVAVFLRQNEPTPIPIAQAEPFDDDHLVWFIALVQVAAEELGVPARMVDVARNA